MFETRQYTVIWSVGFQHHEAASTAKRIKGEHGLVVLRVQLYCHGHGFKNPPPENFAASIFSRIHSRLADQILGFEL